MEVEERLLALLVKLLGQFGNADALRGGRVEVVEHLRVFQQKHLPVPLQQDQVVDDFLHAVARYFQDRLSIGIVAALLDELLVIGQRPLQHPFAQISREGIVGQFVIGNRNHFIRSLAGKLETILGLFPLPALFVIGPGDQRRAHAETDHAADKQHQR